MSLYLGLQEASELIAASASLVVAGAATPVVPRVEPGATLVEFGEEDSLLPQ